MVTTPGLQAKHCWSREEVFSFLAERSDAQRCVVWQLAEGGKGNARRIEPADIPPTSRNQEGGVDGADVGNPRATDS